MRRSWTLAATLALGIGCAKFSGEDSAPGAADAGADSGSDAAADDAERDVVVAVDWPTLPALDPTRDPRAGSIRITIIDAKDERRRAEKTVPANERGPFTFERFFGSAFVDAKIEIVGTDDRLLGYGERRAWNVAADAKIPVLARARLLYFASGDRSGTGSPNGQLRVLGLAPRDLAEPGIDEPHAPLPSLDSPSGLSITREGRWLVQAGTTAVGGGSVAVFETGSHERTKSVPLPFKPGPHAPLTDGHRILVAPGTESNGTVFALVDLDGGASTPLASGLTGGVLTVTSIIANADGTRIAAVGEHRQGGQAESYLFLHRAGEERMQNRKLSTWLQQARGVRFTADGGSVVVAGSNDAGSWATGAIVTFPLEADGIGAPKGNVGLAAMQTRASSLILDPTGNFAFVNNETKYGSGACCGEMRIVDLAKGQEVFVSGYSGNSAELEVVSALQLPYAPGRLLGGQSDVGNDIHGPVVELAGGAKPVKVPVDAREDIGSLDHIATPFGKPL